MLYSSDFSCCDKRYDQMQLGEGSVYLSYTFRSVHHGGKLGQEPQRKAPCWLRPRLTFIGLSSTA